MLLKRTNLNEVIAEDEKSRCFAQEEGRSLLEIIAVVAIMAVLSVGVIAFYRTVMNHQEAEALYEDIRARAILYAERKENARFSTEMREKATYGTLEIDHKPVPDTNYFKLEVANLKTALCNILLGKTWLVMIGENSRHQSLSASRIYINEQAYDPGSLPEHCPEGDNVLFSVVYRSVYSVAGGDLPALCGPGGSCAEDCQYCENGECKVCDPCNEGSCAVAVSP